MEWITLEDAESNNEDTPVAACGVGFTIAGGVVACHASGLLCDSFCLLYFS